jgi:phospholipid-transporting ATPase
MLAEILKQSVSVICCRVSPKGKEEITSIVKKWGRTLAIGDGANDVNMINSAHIGVGVRGIEGSQATRAADYVISEFKHLRRLVLFYGINFYHRNCGVILFTLYKNIFVTFPVLFYGPLSIESAVFIYEMWIFQFYNIFFSALPIVYFGLFDTIYSER